MKSFYFALCGLAIVCVSFGAPPEARIVGGDDAIPGQVPYQVALFVGGSPNCGGVILNENYVLTSMQCVCSSGSFNPWPPQLFTVQAGSIDLYTGGVRIRVQEITISPNPSEFRTGLALLKLETPFVFSDTIDAIQLAKTNPARDSVVDVSGWGRTKDTEQNMYRTLQLNTATIVEAGECSENGEIDAQIVCLGHNRKNGICLGDFGGPAVYQNELIGIGAFVTGECGSFLPDAFTSVATNFEWITNTINA